MSWSGWRIELSATGFGYINLNVGTGSAVGKQMKQLVNERGKDCKLAKLMERIEAGVKHAGS
ncbi:MAG: hypothetical protein HYV36_07260 [Lentisphaerae bacterium]|nr:hypothetical protein [Lentisphaerota bacterium]